MNKVKSLKYSTVRSTYTKYLKEQLLEFETAAAWRIVQNAISPIKDNELDKSSEIEADKSLKSDVSGSNTRSSDSDEVL